MSSNILKDPENEKFIFQIKSFLKNHLNQFKVLPFKGHKQLKEALEYSLFSSGKYFRPLLIKATARLFGLRVDVFLPWAGAIEMFHVASLIHDDLPCMDNAYERRGKATCHRRFGEDMALLAGDCLWIEAFKLLYFYPAADKSAIWLPLLCEAGGFQGLMGGQALDLKSPRRPDADYYQKMHSRKTGALITASIKGVSGLELKKRDRVSRVNKAASLMGEAFQLADDLQDEEENPCNSVFVLGTKKVQDRLCELSSEAQKLINFDKSHSRLLDELIIFNKERGMNACKN